LVIETPDGKNHAITINRNKEVIKELGNGTKELSNYDLDGNCKGRIVWHENSLEDPWFTLYLYSATNELQHVVDSLKGATDYEYDEAHRLIGERTPEGLKRKYKYDAAGNITSSPWYSELRFREGNRLAEDYYPSFQYNERNHLTHYKDYQGQVVNYKYNSMDMLIEVTWNDRDEKWCAEYDGLCRRISKTFGESRTDYYWDEDRLAAELSSDGKIRIYIYSDDEALLPFMFMDYTGMDADPNSGQSYFIFHNQIGLPLRIEDDKGSIVWQAKQIDPFGIITTDLENKIKYNLRFPGHYYDDEIGLHYNRFRYYSPTLGRYLQSDPQGQSGGVNLYSYTTNPLVNVDVLGLDCNKADTNAPESKGGKKKGAESESPPDGEGAARRRPRLTREEGQGHIDAIHDAEPNDGKRISSVTTLTELDDGRLVLTNSDYTTSAMRKEARRRLGPDILIPDEPGNSGFIPKSERAHSDPLNNKPLHGEGRGMQAGDKYGSSAKRQWSSSDAKSHQGAACGECEAAQKRNGVTNETGFQSQSTKDNPTGRFDGGKA
jgi:RHS repeat-associated protein